MFWNPTRRTLLCFLLTMSPNEGSSVVELLVPNSADPSTQPSKGPLARSRTRAGGSAGPAG
jgi:hypothetical protein